MPIHPMTRRRLLSAAAPWGLAIVAAGLPGPARAADEKTYPTDQLLAEQAMPDVWIGSKEAPVTLIEYASMTCTHCAAFHDETFPTLKSKYIDAGKVRFVLREFPLDPLATAGFMLARCVGVDKRNALVDLLFSQQKNWAFVDKPVEALAATVKQAGVSQTAFEACLNDQKLYDQINKERDEASSKFEVNATPTFFINGLKHPGEMTAEELDKVLTPLLTKG